jgi:hypothetical protein
MRVFLGLCSAACFFGVLFVVTTQFETKVWAATTCAGSSPFAVSADTNRVCHQEMNTPFRNPGKGWLVYLFRPVSRPTLSGNSGPQVAQDTPLASAVYTNYITWADLEPTEGSYRWDAIDAMISYWKAKGKKLHIGIMVPASSDRFGMDPIPSWVKNQITGDYYSYTTVWEPDYTNPVFQEKFQNFLRAFGQRYYNTPTGGEDWKRHIEVLDINSFGVDGEWWSKFFHTREDQKYSTLKKMIDQYLTTFNAEPKLTLRMNTIGSMANGPITLDEGDPAAVRYAVEQGGAIMMRRMIGLDPWIKPDEKKFLSDHINERRFDAEWGSWDGTIEWFKGQQSTDPLHYLDFAIDQALGLQASYLGWYKDKDWIKCGTIPAEVTTERFPEKANCKTPTDVLVTEPLRRLHPGTQETLESYFQKNSGYRFYISESVFPKKISPGQTLQIQQAWYQRAVAKLYSQHRIAAYLVSSETRIPLGVDPQAFDAHTWLAGKSGPHTVESSFVVPGTVAPGTYTLQFAIVDRYNEPAMNLAIDGKDTRNLADPVNDYGYYSLGEIVVSGASALCSGDINGDATVDVVDYSLLVKEFMKPADQIINPKADINADNVVNILDFSLLVSNFFKTCEQ